MEINYYLDYNFKNVLIIDLGDMFISISDYAPWIAKNIEEYDYIGANWVLVNKKYYTSRDSKLLNDNHMLKKTIERQQPFFNRKLITVIFN